VVRLVKTWVLTSHNTLVYRRAFMSEFDCDYLILGAGAVGCVFGGLLSKAGKKVQLINSTSETSKAVKKNGLILELDKKTRSTRRGSECSRCNGLYKNSPNTEGDKRCNPKHELKNNLSYTSKWAR
jgi:choline dehydrogenase-like flavoprotein